ncbi:MAG: phosphoribosyltransferase family protein [Alcaligenaceae bacterium]|nr:phosphoribosyltransferase family protein [Alcaligenaceae bacterium]
MRFKPTPYYMGFDYLYPFQNAILQFKNPDTGGTRRLRDALVYILTQNLKRQNISLPKNCCLIPMPSSQTSLHKRGFNPTYLLTQALQQHVHCQMHSTLLIRDAHKVHIKQAGLSQEARRIAVIGHYQCTVQADPDTYYFIIDDILTTGSTLNNAYDVLQEAGAKHIGAITFGRAR